MGTLDKALIDNLTKVFIDFEGAKETLEVYNSAGEIVDPLLRNGSLCSFMSNKHVKMEKLGSGDFGAVFSVTFPCMEEQLYRVVVKMRVPRGKNLDNDACKLPKNMISLLKNNEYVALDGKLHPINPHISYICNKENYSEYIIGVLTGQLYRNGMYKSIGTDDYCINMVNVFEFMTCYKPTKRQYIFMQQSDQTLNQTFQRFRLTGWATGPEKSMLNFVFMQVLMAIRAYQTYNINHNDLKTDNIFLDAITKNTRYNGEYLHEYKYLQYQFGDESFFLPIPKAGYIVKIGDWGQAAKYGMETEPTVANTKVITGHYDFDNFHIPNWFAPAYDLFFFLKSSMSVFMASKFHPDEYLSWMTNDNVKHDSHNRPLNKKVGTYKTVKELLDTKFNSYKIHPKEGKILQVCNIHRKTPWL